MLRKIPSVDYFSVGHDEFHKGHVTPGRTILFQHEQGQGIVYHDVTESDTTHHKAFGPSADYTKFKGRIDTKKKEIMAYYHGRIGPDTKKMESLLKQLERRFRNYTIYFKDNGTDTFMYEENQLNEEKIKFIRPARNFGSGYHRVTVYANAKETKLFHRLMKSYNITPSEFNRGDRRYNIDNIYNFQTTPDGFEFVMSGTPASVKKEAQDFLRSIKSGMAFNLAESKDARSLMTDAGKALHDWIDNDANTYKRRVFPTQKKLLNMALDGKYDRKKAVDMFKKIVDESIKAVERSGEFDEYYTVKEMKDQAILVAAEFRDRFEVEANLGNYDSKDFLELRNRGKSAKGLFPSKR